MKTLNWTLRMTVGVSVLTIAAVLPNAVSADDADGFVLQPIPPAPVNSKTPLSTDADQAPGSKIDAMDTPRVWEQKPAHVLAPPFADTQFGAHPHLGQPYDGGQGYKHYGLPNYRYDIWYRPRPFGVGIAERCAPSRFRPRGFGDLFTEPSNCSRMDYNRYALKNDATDYGPAYYGLGVDQRCPDYDHSDKYRPACDPTRLRRTRVWTISKHRHHGHHHHARKD